MAVLLVLGGTGGWFWWQSQQQASAGGLVASGSVQAQQYQVAAALAGRITAVKVREGDQIAAGTTMVTLDDKALKLVVSQAESGVTAAQAALANARNDGTSADVKAAKARLAQAKAAVSLAKLQWGNAVVKAPHSGTVVTVTANAGQNTSPGKTLITLTDPKDLFVRVFVPETQIGLVKIGQGARISTDSTTATFGGIVSYIATQAEFTPNNIETKDQRVKLVYEVRVRVSDTSQALKSGMPVDVAFQ